MNQNLQRTSLGLVIASLASQCQAVQAKSSVTVPPPPASSMQQPSMIMPHYPKPAAKPAVKSQPVADESVILQSSRPMTVTTVGRWQQWNDYITIRPGQEHMYFILTFENGTGAHALQDLRVRLGGVPIVNSISDFRGSSQLSLNLTGRLTNGTNGMIVQGIGPTGANLNWKLTTVKPVVTSVQPLTLTLSDKVAIQGRNFIEHGSGNIVTIGGKTIEVTNASKSQLNAKLMKGIPSGKQNLIVTVGTLSCSPVQVTIKSAPEVSSVNFVSTAPEQPVTISGSGFSKTMSENKVFFAGIQATITDASENSISCIVPEMTFPRWDVPITVSTNGVDSTGNVTINIQQRVIENQGVPER